MPGRRLIGLTMALALQGHGAATAADATASFAGDIVPLLKTRCATCHLTGAEAGNLALHPQAAYANLVNVASVQLPAMPRVTPGNPGQSYLMLKLTGDHLDAGGTGQRMPFNEAPLDDAILQLFRNWITAGAKDN